MTSVCIRVHPHAFICIHMHSYAFICICHASVCTRMHSNASVTQPHAPIRIHTVSSCLQTQMFNTHDRQKTIQSKYNVNIGRAINAIGSVQLLQIQPNILDLLNIGKQTKNDLPRNTSLHKVCALHNWRISDTG